MRPTTRPAAKGIILATLVLAFTASGALAQLPDVCVPGYSRSHRMPESESQAIKRSMLPPDGRMGDYELDHIVPICLGGSNDRNNLQLQPWSEARAKDDLEVAACRAVCQGRLPLAEARTWFTDWRIGYRRLFGRDPP